MEYGTMTDRVILDYHNGRPSLWLSIVDGEPQLHWLLIGHVDDLDVWVDLALDWIEADRMIDEGAPADLLRFAAARRGRGARLRMLQEKYYGLRPESD